MVAMRQSRAAATVEGLRSVYASGRTKPLAWRQAQLQAALRMLKENEEAWVQAVAAGERKPAAEAELSEVLVGRIEIQHMIKNLSRWTSAKQVGTPLPLIPASSRVERQPFGVTLIIGPFNYPLMLALVPMLGAIAAGCPVVLKPSELCPEVAELFAQLVPAYLDDDAVKVVTGGVPVVTDLLAQRWDNILFTGSERVGKIVAAAAAVHLTPTTLELGGKCPVFIGEAPGNLDDIAYKLMWGRCLNGGQSCVAPEYVLTPRQLVEPLAAAMKVQLAKMYGDEPDRSDSFARVISSASARRIAGLVVGHGGKVAFGGHVDVDSRYVAPTLIVDPRRDSPLMCEEVFGPVITIVPVDSLDEGIAYAASKPTPLSLYLFSSSKAEEERLLQAVPSGNVCVNDVVIHFANCFTPFGGLGASGMGSMHGESYFNCCTQARGVMCKGTDTLTRSLDLQVWLRTAPYAKWKSNIIRFMLHPLVPALPSWYGYKAAAAAVAYGVFSYVLRPNADVLLEQLRVWLG